MALTAATLNACGNDDTVQDGPGTEQPGNNDDTNDPARKSSA